MFQKYELIFTWIMSPCVHTEMRGKGGPSGAFGTQNPALYDITVWDSKFFKLKGFNICTNPLGVLNDAPWCPLFTKFGKIFFFKNCLRFTHKSFSYSIKNFHVGQSHTVWCKSSKTSRSLKILIDHWVQNGKFSWNKNFWPSRPYGA